MKICIAIEKFDPQTGGAERYCWDLAHYLKEQGHSVAVICMRASGACDSAIRVQQVRTLRFPQGLRHLSFALQQRRLAAHKMSDYLHFGVGNTYYMDVYQPHGGLHRAWFVRESRRYAPAVQMLMRLLGRLSLKDMVQRALEGWIFRRTRPEIIAISEMASRDMQAWFDYPREQIHLVPNGINVERFNAANQRYRSQISERYGGRPDEYLLVFVATNLRLKGFDLLLEACERLGKNDFKVLVIGPADKHSAAHAARLGNRIILGGTAADMEKIYPAADCLVHPTYYDTCSLVVLEALASGIPVITTAANGAAMYLDRSSGRVIPAADAQALAGAMAEMLSGAVKAISAKTFEDHRKVFAMVEKVMQVTAVKKNLGEKGESA